MPDFQYQPPTGPLSGSEFERQTTRFFQQVQGAADAAQSTAIAAQITANEAIERAQASNLVDGKTTQADAGGVITVKDVAIGGDLGDLASARGQIGDLHYVSANSSLNDYTKTGQYFIPQDTSIRDTPYIGCPGWLSVSTSGYFIKQEFVEFSAAKKKWMRATDDKNKPENWFAWTEILTTASLGDGLRITNGKLSVPEMQGATASTDGTSGLVPPAAAGQANYVLCGDGEWRDIATLVAAAQARLAESVKAEEGAS